MASDKAQYIVALIAEFAAHYGLTTVQAAQYNVRDLSAYCRRMGGTL